MFGVQQSLVFHFEGGQDQSKTRLIHLVSCNIDGTYSEIFLNWKSWILQQIFQHSAQTFIEILRKILCNYFSLLKSNSSPGKILSFSKFDLDEITTSLFKCFILTKIELFSERKRKTRLRDIQHNFLGWLLW